MSHLYFSNTYTQARKRFKDRAAKVGATITSYRINSSYGDDYTIDVVILGKDNAPTLVISSGVHGVEGFFGSAVQLALFERIHEGILSSGIRFVFIHAVNPFGFSHLRRVNEDNIDLNRNFLKQEETYKGAPEGYHKLNRLLNPKSPPSYLEPFNLIAAYHILKKGWQSRKPSESINIKKIWGKGKKFIKQAVAAGQYEYPDGLFYGGKGPSQSMKIVQEHCEKWIGSSQSIVHVDFHTGLGQFGNYKLLVNEKANSPHFTWYYDNFGPEFVESMARSTIAYQGKGLFGTWMQNHFKSKAYRFFVAEFGTYKDIKILKTLRKENRAHHYSAMDSSDYKLSRKKLKEVFCPPNISWRNKVIKSGLDIIDQAAKGLKNA